MYVSSTSCYCVTQNLWLETFSLIHKLLLCVELAFQRILYEFLLIIFVAAVFGVCIKNKSTYCL
jgi:hypothetical protein